MAKNIVVVIATKNRPSLFLKAIQSVYKQTIKPKEIIVVSDSTTDNRREEDKIIQQFPCTLLIDQYEHNYAGSLNTAIDYFVRKTLVDNQCDLDSFFFAFLDDDDTWRPTYLETCSKRISKNADFIVSGLYYHTNEKSFPLSIPIELNETSFLSVNPHIQGSNTFIRLTTILKAGCFDENMSSTTDRDFFTRVMMLKPKHEIVNEYLVDIDATTDRERLTTLSLGKRESLSKFYSKYGGMMTEDNEKAFFERTNRYSPLIKRDIDEILSFDLNTTINVDKNSMFDKRIIVCSIVSNLNLGARLIDEISKQDYKKLKLVFLANLAEGKESLVSYIKKIGFKDFKVIDIDDIRNDFKKMNTNEFIRENAIKNETITDIAVARTLLHYYVKSESLDGDVIWILDDDMELKSLIRVNGTYQKKSISLKDISARYYGKADIVVGSYSLDAPLPTLSTIRTNLLDYVYNRKLRKNSIYDYSLLKFNDYYYDESDETHRHLETPFPMSPSASLSDVFSGKAISRPLFVKDFSVEFIPYSRGGNTIVFNRNTLGIPNMSITFSKTIARRSDYFWVQQALECGYKVVGSSYATMHNRPNEPFEYEKEVEKSIKDLLGSSFTKAYSKLSESSRDMFYKLFVEQLKHRLTRFIVSYYRIIGLLEIIDEEDKYPFNSFNLKNYIRETLQYTDCSLVESSFDYLMSLSNKYVLSLKIPSIEREMDKCGLSKITLVGNGNEGAIFKDNSYVYKVFYHSFDNSVLKKYAHEFGKCQQLENLSFVNFGTFEAIKYPFHNDNKTYSGGYVLEVVSLLSFLKERGLVITNIKRDNFIICDGILKFIDYGKNIEIITKEKWKMSVERAFEMLKYPRLSLAEFKQIVSMSHQNKTNAISFGSKNLEILLEQRTKEKIHDGIIVSLIKEFMPTSMLDYGAGKCKIPNQFSNTIKTSVFDIDIATLRERADNNVRIIEDIENDLSKYDLVNSNLVLCCTNNECNSYIIKQIHKHLVNSGHAIISFCNPFFTDIQRTENRSSGREEPYQKYSEFMKKTVYGGRQEFHRPFSYYENLFRRNGFSIERVLQDDGVDIENLESISEHIIFVLKKIECVELSDCSLLIKCNPMEGRTIKRSITHIVNQLEYGCSFKEKIVVVDGERVDRNRRYMPDDNGILIDSINELQESGIIDGVLWCDNNEGFELYQKWFGLETDDAYSLNGQQLLSSIKGFERVKTRYVFQTDSDIIYSNRDHELAKAFAYFKQSKAITGSLSICHKQSDEPSYGNRTEVRNSFLDLKRAQEKLPLKNEIEDGHFMYPWHRALDFRLIPCESIRFKSNSLFFIHPQNEMKKAINCVLPITTLIEQETKVPLEQIDKVDLCGDLSTWLKLPRKEMVLFIRGYNTPIEKLHRLFESIRRQNFQGFDIVYVDDASDEDIREYARIVFEYDTFFNKRTISIFNDTRVESLANFSFVVKKIIRNPNAIIVNIDSDDCLLTDDALLTIKKEFDSGADVTVGNCFRTDKPLKKYKVESFKESWLRDGDNIWLHPKCFRRYLGNYIQDNLFMDGHFIDVCTDYAIMLPIVEHAQHPKFIEKQIYYFEPSIENVNKVDKYRNEKKKIVMDELFRRAKREHMKKIVSVIGDGGVLPGSEKYEIARELGRELVDNGYKVQTGGLGGVMEAALKGAKESSNYSKGDTIAILPSLNEEDSNVYADVIIPTGLDIMRNAKVVESDAVIAIGGGAGTLSEIAMAWQIYRLIIGFDNVDGWSKELANKKLDMRVRYNDIPDDCVYGVTSIKDCLSVLNNLIEKYTRKHTKIKWRKEK